MTTCHRFSNCYWSLAPDISTEKLLRPYYTFLPELKYSALELKICFSSAI
jgi:hypothetical protein